MDELLKKFLLQTNQAGQSINNRKIKELSDFINSPEADESAGFLSSELKGITKGTPKSIERSLLRFENNDLSSEADVLNRPPIDTEAYPDKVRSELIVPKSNNSLPTTNIDNNPMDQLLKAWQARQLEAQRVMNEINPPATEQDAQTIDPNNMRNIMIDKLGLPQDWMMTVADRKNWEKDLPAQMGGAAMGSISKVGKSGILEKLLASGKNAEAGTLKTLLQKEATGALTGAEAEALKQIERRSISIPTAGEKIAEKNMQKMQDAADAALPAKPVRSPAEVQHTIDKTQTVLKQADDLKNAESLKMVNDRKMFNPDITQPSFPNDNAEDLINQYMKRVNNG